MEVIFHLHVPSVIRSLLGGGGFHHPDLGRIHRLVLEMPRMVCVAQMGWMNGRASNLPC